MRISLCFSAANNVLMMRRTSPGASGPTFDERLSRLIVLNLGYYGGIQMLPCAPSCTVRALYVVVILSVYTSSPSESKNARNR